MDEPDHVIQLHTRIEKMQTRQFILFMALARSKNTYRRYLETIVELDTVAKRTLSDATYKKLLDEEVRKKDKLEGEMAELMRHALGITEMKKRYVAMECEFLLT